MESCSEAARTRRCSVSDFDSRGVVTGAFVALRPRLAALSAFAIFALAIPTFASPITPAIAPTSQSSAHASLALPFHRVGRAEARSLLAGGCSSTINCTCPECTTLRECLRGFCTSHDLDLRTNTYVPISGTSGNSYVESGPWTCSLVADPTTQSGFRADSTSKWSCVQPPVGAGSPSGSPNELYNGPTVALGFAIAAAAVLMLCCGLAICAYVVAGKNAILNMTAGERAVQYEVPAPVYGVPPGRQGQDRPVPPPADKAMDDDPDKKPRWKRMFGGGN